MYMFCKNALSGHSFDRSNLERISNPIFDAEPDSVNAPIISSELSDQLMLWATTFNLRQLASY